MSDATATFLRLHFRLLLIGLGLPPLALAGPGEPAGAVPQSALQACASIAANTERLACYDRLSRSGAAPANAASQSGAVPATAAANLISPPGAAGAPAASPVAAPSAAGPAKDSFGLYAQEHPKPPPPAPALQAAVVALGKSASGHMTVSLAGGALWELEATDPLLAVGDEVTITRSAFGSYLLQTPTKRAYRARRLH